MIGYECVPYVNRPIAEYNMVLAKSLVTFSHVVNINVIGYECVPYVNRPIAEYNMVLAKSLVTFSHVVNINVIGYECVPYVYGIKCRYQHSTGRKPYLDPRTCIIY